MKRRLVLALSGGGVRGLAQLGALEVLDEAGIRPQGIAGVSIGALVGALYAGGFTPREILERLRGMDWGGVLIDQPDRRSMLLGRKQEHSRHLISVRLDRSLTPAIPGAVAPGQNLYRHLLDLTLDLPHRPAGYWRDMPVPLVILATDLTTGREVILHSGDLTPALRASLSMPLIFDPMTLGDSHLIDGGIVANVPVDLANVMLSGSSVVLAINTTSPLRRLDPPFQAWQIIDQVTTILERETDLESLKRANLLVSPELGELTNFSEVDFDSIFESGRIAMLKKLPKLRSMLRFSGGFDDGVKLNLTQPPKLIVEGDSAESEFNIPDAWFGREPLFYSDVRQFLIELLSYGAVRYAWAEWDSADGTLIIRLQHNPRLNSVAFDGVNPAIVREPERLFDGQIGRPLDFHRCDASLASLLRRYREAGYPAARIFYTRLDTLSGALHVLVDEGKVAQIEFPGLERVPKTRLESEIPLGRGDLVTKAGIIKGMSNLYATGLFRSVYPSLRLDGDGWVVEMRVSEHSSPPFRLGLAYLSERRTRGFAEISYPATLRYSARLALFTSAGERDSEHRLSFLRDSFAGLPLYHDVTASYTRLTRTSYDRFHAPLGDYTERRWGGAMEIGGNASGWGLLVMTARLERHENFYAADSNAYSLAGIGGRLEFDTFDRFPFPYSGVKFKAEVGSGFGLGGGFTDKFNRMSVRVESFASPLDRYTAGIRGFAATADRNTPSDERFKMGGMHSFPGLHLDELIGRVQIAGGLEMRYDLLSRLLADSYIGARFDVGGSWSDPEAQIVRRDWMPSMSVYFVLDTVLGPIQLQWGHLFPSGALKRQGVFYIQAGNMF